MTDHTCRCIGVKDALRHALHDEPAPVCAEHDRTTDTSTPPIALNDNATLAARIGATLSNGDN